LRISGPTKEEFPRLEVCANTSVKARRHIFTLVDRAGNLELEKLKEKINDEFAKQKLTKKNIIDLKNVHVEGCV